MALKSVVAAAVLAVPPCSAEVLDTNLPGLYRVTTDIPELGLSVHADPHPNDLPISRYDADERDIEVIGLTEDGVWAMVGFGRKNGFVSARYLSPEEPTYLDPVANQFRCFGTDPFWSLDLAPGGKGFAVDGGLSERPDLIYSDLTETGYIAQLDFGSDMIREVVIESALCRIDGNDRLFGWSITLFEVSPERSGSYQGCCTLDAR